MSQSATEAADGEPEKSAFAGVSASASNWGVKLTKSVPASNSAGASSTIVNGSRPITGRSASSAVAIGSSRSAPDVSATGS